MIRMALTLSICSQDAQNTSFLVNGTLLGMLSSTSQRTHVQTTHRPMQLMVAIKDAGQSSSASMIKQQQIVSVWQEFFKILSKRQGHELNGLLHQYHMTPEWLIVLDDRRLQAWLPVDLGFYLFRDGELRRLRPAAPRDAHASVANIKGNMLQYFSIILNHHDQLFLLPPVLFNFFSANEAAEVLLDMRQQPAKVSDLLYTARLRGFADEITWFAMEVLHHEEDHHPDSGEKPTMKERMPWLFGKVPSVESEESESDTIELGVQDVLEPPAEMQPIEHKPPPKKWLPYYLGLGAFAVILIIVIAALVMAGRDKSGDTATTPSSTTAPLPTVTADPLNPDVTPALDLPVLMVNASQLNLRQAASRESKLLATLVTGDKLYQLSPPEGDWVKVLTMDGMEGFVYNTYVTAATDAG